jgi:hypothetical protein
MDEFIKQNALIRYFLQVDISLIVYFNIIRAAGQGNLPKMIFPHLMPRK